MNAIIQKLMSKPVVDFCRHWQIVELGVFGSALREDFTDENCSLITAH